ncbi:MAG: polysaccharide deacetylase family protein [Muribaculaceae bacterium]|nr:polysaccharide deacetylase family protein [Muribaculaceae bacterium]
MLIERPPLLYRLLFPGAVWRINTHPAKAVYLTFDDGPIPEVTPWVLDMLDSRGAKATFFMVGQNAERHPDLVDEVISRGHSVGNHTMHHMQGAKATLEEYSADISAAEPWLGGVCDKPAAARRLFRPPHGLMRLGQLRKVRADGYAIIMHDVVARDYDAGQSPERVVRNVVRNVRPGSVVVLHDSLKAWPRLRHALPLILDHLTAMGYQLPPIQL